jgi:hypothetical protein
MDKCLSFSTSARQALPFLLLTDLTILRSF